MAMSIARMPLTQALTPSSSERMRWPTESPIATRQPASDPHRSATNESEAPKMSRSAAPGPVLAAPVV